MFRYLNATSYPHFRNGLEDEQHTGRIKITNGEQFVPLYLILLTTKHPAYYDQPTHLSESDKQSVKEYYLKELREGIPTEYSFISTNNAGWQGYTEQRQKVFSGNDVRVPITSNKGVTSSTYITLGLYCRTQSTPLGVSMKSKAYPSVGFTMLERVHPELLVLVKAKHLAYLRACLLLQAPIELPYTDLKVLRTAAPTSEAVTYLTEMGAANMQMEYTTSEVMSSYLVKPRQQKTAEQLLQSAVKAMKTLESASAII